MYAQDRKLRHVAIKALHIESEEYRIIHFLSQQSQETMRENCFLPVLELLYFRKACFLVMPRYVKILSLLTLAAIIIPNTIVLF